MPVRQKIKKCKELAKWRVMKDRWGCDSMTDEQLLRKLQAQQPEALEALMKKYHRYVQTIIGGILGSSGGAEDVEELMQDTFYAVWTHADSISGKLRTYLSATARNRAKSFLRNHRELPMDLDTIELPDPGGSLENAAQEAELSRCIQNAIWRMRPRDREIFLRYYYHFQTAETISRQMGIPPGTIYSRLARGRKVLQKTLSKEDWL